MTLEQICKQVLELDERATNFGYGWSFEKDGWIVGLKGPKPSGYELICDCSQSCTEKDGELIENYRTSAPVLARVVLRMKKALEAYVNRYSYKNESNIAIVTLHDIEEIVKEIK